MSPIPLERATADWRLLRLDGQLRVAHALPLSTLFLESMQAAVRLRDFLGGWPALSVVPTHEGAPLKLRLGGGFLCGLHSWENSGALTLPRRALRFDFHTTLFSVRHRRRIHIAGALFP